MTDRPGLHWGNFNSLRVVTSAYAVVVLAKMEGHVDGRDRADRLVEYLHHARVVTLVDDGIEFEKVGHRIHLELSAPDRILRHIITVFLDRFVVFDEGYKVILVLKNILYSPLTVTDMLSLVALELIGDGAE